MNLTTASSSIGANAAGSARKSSGYVTDPSADLDAERRKHGVVVQNVDFSAEWNLQRKGDSITRIYPISVPDNTRIGKTEFASSAMLYHILVKIETVSKQ